jgi:hypothetical protein
LNVLVFVPVVPVVPVPGSGQFLPEHQIGAEQPEDAERTSIADVTRRRLRAYVIKNVTGGAYTSAFLVCFYCSVLLFRIPVRFPVAMRDRNETGTFN